VISVVSVIPERARRAGPYKRVRNPFNMPRWRCHRPELLDLSARKGQDAEPLRTARGPSGETCRATSVRRRWAATRPSRTPTFKQTLVLEQRRQRDNNHRTATRLFSTGRPDLGYPNCRRLFRELRVQGPPDARLNVRGFSNSAGLLSRLDAVRRRVCAPVVGAEPQSASSDYMKTVGSRHMLAAPIDAAECRCRPRRHAAAALYVPAAGVSWASDSRALLRVSLSSCRPNSTASPTAGSLIDRRAGRHHLDDPAGGAAALTRTVTCDRINAINATALPQLPTWSDYICRSPRRAGQQAHRSWS